MKCYVHKILNHRYSFEKLQSLPFLFSGYVVDDNGRPISNAHISINHGMHSVTSGKNGAYWRLISPGKYFFFSEIFLIGQLKLHLYFCDSYLVL